jgi:hypothetical protein
VQFVENIRNYTDKIMRLEKPMAAELAPERSLTGDPIKSAPTLPVRARGTSKKPPSFRHSGEGRNPAHRKFK